MALNPLYCLSPSQALGAKKKQDSWLCLYRTVHSVTSGESLGSQGPLMTSCCCRLPTSVAPNGTRFLIPTELWLWGLGPIALLKHPSPTMV